MSHELIIRAWKDSAFRNSLSAEELAQLPANPAGEILTEAELESVIGGCSSNNQGGRRHHRHHRHGGDDGGYDFNNQDQDLNQNTTINPVQIAFSLTGDINQYSECNNRGSNGAYN